MDPSKLKYKKIFQRSSFQNKEKNYTVNNQFKFGVVGIQAKVKGVLTPNQINAAQRVIMKRIKNVGKVWSLNNPNLPKTKKPQEVRMGKGKGGVKSYFCRVKAGSILFEVSLLDGRTVNALNSARKKLPVPTKIIYKST